MIHQKSYNGLISESEGYKKVINFIKSNLDGSPEWFSTWLLNFKYKNLDDVIGINPIGPVHGDINKNNCWFRNDILYLVDFEMFENNSPMIVDLIKWILHGDLNFKTSILSKRVKRILRKGIKGIDFGVYGLENFNKKEDIRAGVILITLLFECYWGLKRNFSFSNTHMIAITNNIKYVLSFLNSKISNKNRDLDHFIY